MRNNGPKFQEEYSAKLPALALLSNLGWQYLSPQEALNSRNQKTEQAVLTSILKEVLTKRTFTYAQKSYPLSEQSIQFLINQLVNPSLNEGLIKANESMYNHLLYGIAVTEFVNGKRITVTIPIIDWENRENNQFHYTEEFTLSRSGLESRRPDIVCFVNGLPLVVIEAKRPDRQIGKWPTIDEGISQTLRNQRNNEIPNLFVYSQLLLSINGSDGRYGTCGTAAKFWATWREEEFSLEQMNAIKNTPLAPSQLESLFVNRSPETKVWFQNYVQQGLAVTKQDELLIALLSKERLLDFTHYFMIFDKRKGKVTARYQQFFGIKKLLQRINSAPSHQKREGGVLWHTTGSGKSFTMVFLSKIMILHPDLKQCRIVVVTDRVDLEQQLSRTFSSSGELVTEKDQKAALATSGKRLAEQIGLGTERIIFSLIQKFNTATQQSICFNDSRDIIVLIDEGHRTQGDENHNRMREALPNAAFIAFTGTPLLKKDKTTNKFGPIIHAYTMQRAVEDKMVTPLLYEERIPELDVNDKVIDNWFEKITLPLNEEQKADLKRKYSRKGAIYSAKDRIYLIAADIANHFDKNIPEGLKGQLACDSKLSAIRYKQFLDELGLFESAVIISPPDTREGNTEVSEQDLLTVNRWWNENIKNQDEKNYPENLIARFADEHDPLKILIVVDKLLTGFDEEKNSVLYIDKPLKDHNLMQAIARINRLHEKKEFGLLIDYRGILKELDTTIIDYQDLATKTQKGYDVSDINGLYEQMSAEYKKLPALYQELWGIFSSVKNKLDIEQLRQQLIPKLEKIDGNLVDMNQKKRDQFYEILSKFNSTLNVALQSRNFFSDTSFNDEDRAHYKETRKQFLSLKTIIMQDTEQSINYAEYDPKIKKLLDKYVMGIQIKEPEGTYRVDSIIPSEQAPEDWNENKLKNETDLIKTRITKSIELDLLDDPYAQEAFSKLLKETIEEAESLFDSPVKSYLVFHQFEQKLKNRELEEIPKSLKNNLRASAYFGLLKQQYPLLLNQTNSSTDEYWPKLMLTIDEMIESAIKENSINPLNLESEIRQKLLPLLFNEFKKSGLGLEETKEMIEKIIEIIRIRRASI